MTNLGSPKLHYAPGYPILISPAFLFGDRPFLLLALMQWGFAMLFMIGLYRWTLLWFPTGALWVTVLVIVNAGFWTFERLTVSEMAFMAALMGNVNALDRLSDATTRRATLVWTIVSALGVTGLSLIRPVGVLIVVGYGCLALKGAWTGRIAWTRAVTTSLMVGLPATLAVLAFISHESRMARVLGPKASSNYLDEFRLPEVSVAEQLLEGTRVRISEFGRLVVPGMLKAYAPTGRWLNVNTFIYVPLFLALMWSWWQLAGKKCSALFWILPFYLVLHIAYPSEQGTRYIIPLLPLLAACVWRLACLAPGKQPTYILGSLVAIHLCVTLGSSFAETARLYRQQSHWASVDVLLEVINGDPRPFATCGAPRGTCERSQVATNQSVEWILDPKRLSHYGGWVISAADDDIGPDFVEAARAGELKLLTRKATLTAAADAISSERR
ncbi:MAG TPA: hypothetical protein VGJ26_18550 [Pirellulales bacterium]